MHLEMINDDKIQNNEEIINSPDISDSVMNLNSSNQMKVLEKHCKIYFNNRISIEKNLQNDFLSSDMDINKVRIRFILT